MEQDITIITSAKPISLSALHEQARNGFGDLVKGVVDIQKEIMALGGELHADEEALLLSQGSAQEQLWGINLYPEKSGDEWLEFDSMINIRPRQGNRSRGVEDKIIQAKIRAIVTELVAR